MIDATSEERELLKWLLEHLSDPKGQPVLRETEEDLKSMKEVVLTLLNADAAEKFVKSLKSDSKNN